MPRGAASIREKRKAFVREKIKRIEEVVPEGLKSLVGMILDDIKQENYQMAAARCINMKSKLDQAPTVKMLLGLILPEFARLG